MKRLVKNLFLSLFCLALLNSCNLWGALKLIGYVSSTPAGDISIIDPDLIGYYHHYDLIAGGDSYVKISKQDEKNYKVSVISADDDIDDGLELKASITVVNDIKIININRGNSFVYARLLELSGNKLKIGVVNKEISYYVPDDGIIQYIKDNPTSKLILGDNGKPVLNSEGKKLALYSDFSVTRISKESYDNSLAQIYKKRDGLGIESSLYSPKKANTMQGEKYGYVDKDNNWVVKPEYDRAEPFRHGYARVQNNGKWGLVNTRGDLIVPCKYDDIFDEKNGMIKVQEGTSNTAFSSILYGFYNIKGELLTEIVFTYASDFDKDCKCAAVRVEDKMGQHDYDYLFIDTEGYKIDLNDDGNGDIFQRINGHFKNGVAFIANGYKSEVFSITQSGLQFSSDRSIQRFRAKDNPNFSLLRSFDGGKPTYDYNGKITNAKGWGAGDVVGIEIIPPNFYDVDINADNTIKVYYSKEKTSYFRVDQNGKCLENCPYDYNENNYENNKKAAKEALYDNCVSDRDFLSYDVIFPSDPRIKEKVSRLKEIEESKQELDVVRDEYEKTLDISLYEKYLADHPDLDSNLKKSCQKQLKNHPEYKLVANARDKKDGFALRKYLEDYPNGVYKGYANKIFKNWKSEISDSRGNYNGPTYRDVFNLNSEATDFAEFALNMEILFVTNSIKEDNYKVFAINLGMAYLKLDMIEEAIEVWKPYKHQSFYDQNAIIPYVPFKKMVKKIFEGYSTKVDFNCDIKSVLKQV